jgi:phage-related protein
MRFFAKDKCRVVILCGTLFAFGGMTQNLNAQEAQGQGSSRSSDVAQFDAFLDAHADVAAQLRANPSLLTNAEYLEAHPQIEAFLNQHPQVQSQIAQNPSFFMDREKRFDAKEVRRRTNPNPDLTKQQVATLDEFLDSHPDVDKTLRGNPWLIRNAQYLKEHPELQTFLNQHPELKEESAETPAYLMQREKRFDAQERRRGENPDLTRQQVATLDQFLDTHPDIDKTLSGNPWLIRNAQYLKEHPELQTFLNQHPELKEESAETPAYLMQREKRFDAREARRGDQDFDRDRDASARRDRDFDRDRSTDRDRDSNASRDFSRRSNSNPDLSNQEVASMDDFLDRHRDVAKSLEKKPELINDRGYLKRHKDLDEFLSEHPAVREEVRENPSSFMRRENRFEARNMDRDVPDRDRNRSVDVDRGRARDRDDRADADLNKKELQDMDRFLDKHKKIEKDLQKNPSLVNDEKYLKQHKSLEAFLSKNPQVSAELKENPSTFMQKQQRLEQRKMNNHQPIDKHKTKIEEKEQMHTATPH